MSRGSIECVWMLAGATLMMTACSEQAITGADPEPPNAQQAVIEQPPAPAVEPPASTPPPAPALEPSAAPEPSNDGGFDTRSFQMILWDDAEAIGSDLAFFTEGQHQPNGISVLRVLSWWKRNAETNPELESKLVNYAYDWSRIAAVLIDEPYWYNTGARDESNPCRNPADPRNEAIAKTATQLADAARVVNNLSPSTRFWVNFSTPEMDWARDSQCPVAINQPYIDVVSLDYYCCTFPEVVQPYYEWLSRNRASSYQQFALVPGTFFRSGLDDPVVRASYLKGYFDYANSMNQRCNLPIGRVGITGNWDGCPVWLLLGWLASNYSKGGVEYKGVFDPLSSAIATEWNNQFARPKIDPLLGAVEAYDATTRTFTGWAISANALEAAAPLVEMWIDQEPGPKAIANLARPDIRDRYGRYHSGFSIAFPNGYVGGCHSVRIYAIAPTGEPYNRILLPVNTNTEICL